ncbi:MAG: hypothetical protein COS87_01900 [Chloroflexi bacterium CG07_land_8_20_14_0_80_45_17]|nr:MAG: hypothetical protein COS87_01900 [Chloroflexi bacterium CG07_land_8_20_14_0_80_45_17]
MKRLSIRISFTAYYEEGIAEKGKFLKPMIQNTQNELSLHIDTVVEDMVHERRIEVNLEKIF